MKEKIYFLLPDFLQNILITIFNILQYRVRYGGNYKNYLALFKKKRTLTLEQLLEFQKERYSNFVRYAVNNSPYYKSLFSGIKDYDNINYIRRLPLTNKEDLRSNSHNINTILSKEGVLSKTGGTTGKSLSVLFTNDNIQERFAMLDDFRSRFGYKLGKKTAWFSGKNLLNNQDIRRNRFWKTDNLYNIRYYSTFHIKKSYLNYYIENLIRYKVEYIVGFPSSLLDIAKYGLKNNYSLPLGMVKAIFPTAETITQDMRLYIEKFFKARMYDQYASSEGAAFIFECEKRNLHVELQSGVFEVLNDDNEPSKSGRLIQTSFTTEGTPLIRYDIEDSITLSNEVCSCSNKNPLVKEIHGRENDFIYSPERGKINLGNVSNTLKNTKGIVKFQVVQDNLNEILIKLQVDRKIFNEKIENIFIKNWIDRVGDNIKIEIDYVQEIEVEKSGKFRIVKNNIKHLIEHE